MYHFTAPSTFLGLPSCLTPNWDWKNNCSEGIGWISQRSAAKNNSGRVVLYMLILFLDLKF
jgi:hypothetical protein